MKGIFIAIIMALCISLMAIPCFAQGTTDKDLSEEIGIGEAASDSQANDMADSPLKDENEEDFNIEKYLTEKIIPVIAGVATSVIALMGGLAKIKGAVGGLDKTGKELTDIKERAKSTLDGMERELKDGIADIEKKLEGIPEIREGYDKIKEGCQELRIQNEKLLEALRLGFESLPETVKCGNARKIALLMDKDTCKETEK